MTWTVKAKRRVEGQVRLLPRAVKESLFALMLAIEKGGPVRGDWPNYGKIGANRHHCHLKKGRPTYVAVWEEIDRTARIVEVTYVGTHEKAPY